MTDIETESASFQEEHASTVEELKKQLTQVQKQKDELTDRIYDLNRELWKYENPLKELKDRRRENGEEEGGSG